MNSSFEKALTILNAHKLNESQENKVRHLLTECVTCYRQASFYGLTDNIRMLGDTLSVDKLSKDDQVKFTENLHEMIKCIAHNSIDKGMFKWSDTQGVDRSYP